jgi:hypothetical protein
MASMTLSETPAFFSASSELVLVSKLAGLERMRARTTASLRPPLSMATIDSLVSVSCAAVGVARPATTSTLRIAKAPRVRRAKAEFLMSYLLRDESIRRRDKSRAGLRRRAEGRRLDLPRATC